MNLPLTVNIQGEAAWIGAPILSAHPSSSQ
jgi:hypothetical protein